MDPVLDFESFKASLGAASPPATASALSRALWLDARGDWEGAHSIAQDVDDSDGARVHAYLHRKEGDLANAGYWYRRAGEKLFEGSLDAEWEALARRFL